MISIKSFYFITRTDSIRYAMTKFIAVVK